MELKVFWTDTARYQFEDIFDFLKYKSGVNIAKNIVTRIIDKTLTLEKHPTIGQIEELLQNREYDYRYLIEGNYKIIYWIENNYIKIAAVFDCRQNPHKMQQVDNY